MHPSTQILYLSHGGGPLPLLGDPGHREMIEQLPALAGRLPRPAAILLVSAHWESPEATVTTAARPPLLYDYYGFPPASYEIRYPCPGDPALASEVRRVLADSGIASGGDGERGLDHGAFVPLKLMYPDADIPCVQLSLLRGLDARAHLAMGEALRQLEVRDLLVMGSGLSFHNMDALRGVSMAAKEERNRAFEDWLVATCANPDLTWEQQYDRLLHWEQAPHARYCHPREEHLLPLHVCAGMARSTAALHQPCTVMDTLSSTFLWGSQ